MIINYNNYKVLFGKISRIKNFFIEIFDYSGKIQIYSKKKFKLGDIIKVYGIIKKTKKKILYIISFYINLLVKSLKNEKNIFYFKKKFCFFNFILNYFKKFMYIFSNTNNFCKIKSNSNANNFKTYSFYKKKFFYLKISPEFYMKKLISNNYNRVFDITKCYRNEGCSNIHNVEFNMLEYYSMNHCFLNSIFFLENFIKNIYLSNNYYFLNIYKLVFNKKIFFKKKLLLEIVYLIFLKKKIFFIKKFFFLYLLYKKKIIIKNFTISNIFFKFFDEFFKKKNPFPFFLCFFPTISSPLTKIFNLNINFLKRFELYISSIEISNGYEELNDYYIQKKNFNKKNKEFLLSIKNSLNNTSGVGVGLDRLFMIIFKIKHINKI